MYGNKAKEWGGRMRPTIFLFGEAEKGEYGTPLLCRSMPQLADTLGNPPEDTQGIFYAVQAILFERDLFFYRVREEGFSVQDYMKGLHLLQGKDVISSLTAICIPGVGDAEIIEAVSAVCHVHKSLMVVTQQDLYDYLTALPKSFPPDIV